ncbi:L-ascorbate metabolism protein UlaG, beta-lactamase superfamily [Bryocella elongata]|uniref:L-ascorbate metabolism protein UlaG, beta-lactamase superfamily n=1 Tax=Bryocella elongata TaxID=863522 RepID=A0A1H5ULF3_9BACT|nr:MBL fold metallo-hydrolase [Bryocella elongata]SEF75844.1 L-ascorbate metabolism protein UlaG, beta-lactamase superfamily [Bryocella elongata]
MTMLARARKEKGLFQNPVPTAIGGFSTMWKVLPEFLFNRGKAYREPKGPLGPFPTPAEVYATAPASGLRVTWFGHSCQLIEIDGFRVLIDPVWEDRAAPTQSFGPKRFFAPTIALEDLPPLDVVLVSHDHYDHLGSHTHAKLAKLPNTARARWVTSLGVGERLRRFGVDSSRITELDWTQSTEIPAAGGGTALRITAWPSRHFSGRGLSDRFTTLWSSFVLEGPEHRVYFGADSGYWPGFAEIAAQYDRLDLVMLEIGASNPLWENIHLGPDNATRAYTEMAAALAAKGGGGGGAGLFMPIHWGLFNLALHAWKQPVERMLEIAGERDLPLWLPEPGQPTEIVAGQPLITRWWERWE